MFVQQGAGSFCLLCMLLGRTDQPQHLCLPIRHSAWLLPAAGAVGVKILQQGLYHTLPGLGLHMGARRMGARPGLSCIPIPDNTQQGKANE